MACLQHFNHKEQVWNEYGMMEIIKMTSMDDYDINVTLNKNDKV